MVIGAAKCGTTSLCYLLGRHPQVFMSNPKEPHFFGREGDPIFGKEGDPKKTIEWYESHFDNAVGKIAIGEGSTSYTHPDIIRQAASGIAEYAHECRLIYMVRHPLRRLESDWKMRRYEGWAPASINEAITNQETLTVQRTLITHGMYWQNLSEYRRLFPDEQILIVFLEDFMQNPAQELKRCFQHMNANPSVTIDGVEQPRNQSRNARRDGLISGYLRKTPYFERMKTAMPGWLRTSAKLLFTRKEDLTFQWDEHIRSSVIEELREDSHKFLEYCDKPADFWELQ